MKSPKKHLIILATALFCFTFTTDTYAVEYLKKKRAERQQNNNNNHNSNHNHNNGNNPVGAPIDGGILTILGAAGVGYYLVRKKKEQ